MLYLLHGENTYQSTNRLEEIKEEVLAQSYTEVKKVEAGEVEDINEFLSSADSFSLFTKKQLFIVKRAFSLNTESQEKIVQFLKNSNKTSLIFWEPQSADKRRKLYKTIKKKGVVEEFSFLSYNRLKSWLSKYISKQINFHPSCIDSVILKIGQDQMQITKTVDNLVMLVKADNRNKILPSDINLFIEKTVEEDIWEFVDALSVCNRVKALEIVERLVHNKGDFVQVVGMITRQLRILSQVKWLLKKRKNRNDIIKILKLHPFVVRKAAIQSKNFEFETLRKLYQKLTNTDLVVKTGRFEEKLALDLFIAAL